MKENKVRKDYYIDQDLLKGIELWLKDHSGNGSEFVRNAIDEKLKKDLGRSWRNQLV